MKNNSHHLKLAQFHWENFLKKNFTVIDATCGNGHDTLYLAKLLKKLKGKLFCFDIQKKALENTNFLLENFFETTNLKNIKLVLDSHENFSNYVSNINLIVYNLGYLPKADKTITTLTKTTLLSIKNALKILDNIGAISIVAYPGHEEGYKEEKELIKFLKTLDKNLYNVCYHKWINKEKSPSFFWIEKNQLARTSATT